MVITADKEMGPAIEPSVMVEKPVSSSSSFSTWRSVASQSRLHNFSFPNLSWGNQRFLRCVNLSKRAKPEELLLSKRSSSSFHEDAPSSSKQIPRIRGQKRRISNGEEADQAAPSAAASLRPWNLRTRRAACNAPVVEIGQNPNPNPPSSSAPSAPSTSPLPQEKINSQARRLRSRLEGANTGERRKFSIALSKAEIEEDFAALKSAKPLRRPKKRAKYLQRQLDSLFPGSLLCEVTPDLYKVDEKGS